MSSDTFNQFIAAIATALVVASLYFILIRFFFKRRDKVQQFDVVQESLKKNGYILHNLPSRQIFINRYNEIRTITEALQKVHPYILIRGIGGIGKTSLAMEIAHEMLEKNLFEAIIWIDILEIESINDFLDSIVNVLDFPWLKRETLENKIKNVKDILKEKSSLLIIDNFESLNDKNLIGFLKKIPEPTKVLITSRTSIPLDAFVLTINSLSTEDTILLIREEGEKLGISRIAEIEEKELHQLALVTGGNPLATKWSVSQMGLGKSMPGIIHEINNASAGILDFLLGQTWGALDQPSRMLLMVISIFPGTTSSEVLMLITGFSEPTMSNSFAQLLNFNLIDSLDRPNISPRFSLHPLTKNYANSKFKEDYDLWIQVHSKSIEIYKDFVIHYGGKWWTIWDDQFALIKIDNELDNIRYLMKFCSENERFLDYVDFVSGLHSYLGVRGYLEERILIGMKANEFARKTNDIYSMAWLCGVVIPWSYWTYRDTSKTRRYAFEGLDFAKKIGEHFVEAYANHLIASTYLYDGNIEKANQFVENCYKAAKKHGHKSILGIALADYGYVEFEKGNLEEAENWLQDSVDVFLEAGDEERLSGRLIVLGDVIAGQGRDKEALELYSEGLTMANKTLRLDYQAMAQFRIATQYGKLRRNEEALKFAYYALKSYERLRIPEFAVQSKLLFAKLQDDKDVNI